MKRRLFWSIVLWALAWLLLTTGLALWLDTRHPISYLGLVGMAFGLVLVWAAGVVVGENP